MASAVTTPLERQFGQMPSLAQMTSVSSFGSSQITLQFTLDRNIDAAEQDVQAAINAASNLLPADAAVAAHLQQEQPGRHAHPHPRRQLRRPCRSTRSTTTPTRSWRRRSPRSRAWASSPSTAARSPRCACRSTPRRSPARASAWRTCAPRWRRPTSTSPRATSTARARTTRSPPTISSTRPTRFRPLVIAYKQRLAGPALRRGRRALDGVENTQLAGWAGDKRAIILNVQRQPGANVIQVADAGEGAPAPALRLAAARARGPDPRPTAPRPCAPRSTTSSSRSA